MPDEYKPNLLDPLYEKHHNIIDGIYTVRHPSKWDEIQKMDKVDAEDEDGELYALFRDIRIIDIENINGLDNPSDEISIDDYVFILRRNGKYYICETQGMHYIKFASEISDVDFIKMYDRMDKIYRLFGKEYPTLRRHPLL